VGRSRRRTDAAVMGGVMVCAILSTKVIQRVCLFVAAWLLLTDKILVLGSQK
jgi:hypothetical protein